MHNGRWLSFHSKSLLIKFCYPQTCLRILFLKQVLVIDGFIIIDTQVHPLSLQRFRENSDLVARISQVLKFEDHSRSELRFSEEVWMNIFVGKGNQFSGRAV